jgi:hypothetical protein
MSAPSRSISFAALAGLMTLQICTVRPLAAERDPAALAESRSTTAAVYSTWDPATVLGTSKLVRTDAGISASLHSSMPAGQAVTMWFVVFNHPEFCATSPCTPADMANPAVMFDALYGGGHVEVGGLQPVGLQNPLGAEVFLMLHSHGPAGRGRTLKEQISSFTGGCDVFLGPGGVAAGPGDVPDATGECSTTQVAIHQ